MDRSGSRAQKSGLQVLIDYVLVIWKYRRLLATLFLVSTSITGIVTIYSQKIYESRSTILVPEESSSSRLGSVIQASTISSIPGISIPSLTQNEDLFLSVLLSRTMAKEVVERFNLQERYKSGHLNDAISSLRGRVTISASKMGTITVLVEETDPSLAAEIANFYVSNLDAMLTRFEIEHATKKHAFIEQRLESTRKSLLKSEQELKRFQEENKAFALKEQSLGFVEATGDLQERILAAEVELEAMRGFATESNPNLVILKRRIEQMKKQLLKQLGAQMQMNAEEQDGGNNNFEGIPPLNEFPELSLELSRLMREVRVQENIYMLLIQQLEEAKIAESRDIPQLHVLDKAVPAVQKSRPIIRLNLAIAGFSSLALGIILAFFLEFLKGVKRDLNENLVKKAERLENKAPGGDSAVDGKKAETVEKSTPPTAVNRRSGTTGAKKGRKKKKVSHLNN